MKFRFLALSIFLATILFSSVDAKVAKIFPENGLNVLSKGSPKIPFYKAADNSNIALNVAPNFEFTRLPFTQYKRKELNGVYPSSNNKGFIVEKGSYIINFTGTFTATSNLGTNTMQLAVQVGSKFFNIQANVIEDSASNDNVQTLSTTQLFHFDKTTKISIVGRNLTTGGAITVGQRTLSIIKVG